MLSLQRESARRRRRLGLGFFGLYALATVFQEPILGQRLRPTLFGLPLAYLWVVGWVFAAGIVLLALERLGAE